MSIRLVQFIAIILTALALVPAGAHLFELPNKIDLPLDAYFTVQGIYRGWALFGFVLIPAMIVNGIVAVLLRSTPRAFAACAALLLALNLAIFFAWTFPANQATANWTAPPPDWESLRTQREYSHAANAVLTFVALCSATLSALMSRDEMLRAR